MKKLLLAFILGFLSWNAMAQDQCMPVGWGTENGGITGGGNATPVVCTTRDQLANAVDNSNTVIHISGTITFGASERITIQDVDNITIFGLPGAKLVSTDMTKSGSGIFYIKRTTNLIIQNITFEGPGAYDADGYDNLCIDNCQNVWVDHCDFQDGMDGNFDIKNMSDYVSVTWCIFQYKKPPKAGGSGGSPDHRYTNLIGSSASATGDRTHLNTTFQYCWWGDGCRERMPRVRFGKIHLLNSYFSSSVSNYCARAGEEANILIEGCYFDRQNEPVDLYKSNAAVGESNNISTGGSISTQNTSSVFNPPYDYTVDDPNTIVAPIKSCAGATLPGWGQCSDCQDGGNKRPSVSISNPVDGGSIETGSTVTIENTATDPDGSVANVFYYLNGTLIHEEWLAPYDFDYEFATAGTYTLKAVATDDQGATGETSIIIRVSSPYTVSLNTSGQGVASPDINGTHYSGDKLTAIAYPYIGYEFTGWTGDISSTEDSIGFTLSGNTSITANFAPTTGATRYEFEYGSWDAGTASFEKSHPGFSGSGYVNTENQANSWTELTVYAQTAGTHTSIVHYSATDDRPINIDVNGIEQISNHSMPATATWDDWATTTFSLDLEKGENTLRFIGPTAGKGAPNLDWISFESTVQVVNYTLTVNQPANGSISPSSGSYAEGTEVELTATPNNGYIFSNWTGASTGTTNPITITINADTEISAVFELVPVVGDVSLKAGWNLIGYPIEGSADLETALSSIWDKVISVKDANGFYNPSQATFLNSLSTLEWSKGYFINVSEDCELVW